MLLYYFFPFVKKTKKVCNVCNFIAAVPWCWFCVLLHSFSLTLTHMHTHTYTAIFLRNLFILLHPAGSVKHLKGERLCKGGSTIKECVCVSAYMCTREKKWLMGMKLLAVFLKVLNLNLN